VETEKKKKIGTRDRKNKEQKRVRIRKVKGGGGFSKLSTGRSACPLTLKFPCPAGKGVGGVLLLVKKRE